MKKFYFTYGTDSRYPFRGGWTLVYATDLNSAIRIFREYHPNREGSDCLNCADYYTAENFEKREIYKTGNFGAYCHETIGRKTNYEHIMAMSVDELAEFLNDEENLIASCKASFCSCYKDDGRCTAENREASCIVAMKNWLESEAKT